MRLRTAGVTWQEIDGELVILDMERSVYLTTNGSGALLTKLLAQDRTEGDLADALVDEFSIDHETALRDVRAFVDSLTQKKLLA